MSGAVTTPAPEVRAEHSETNYNMTLGNPLESGVTAGETAQFSNIFVGRTMGGYAPAEQSEMKNANIPRGVGLPKDGSAHCSGPNRKATSALAVTVGKDRHLLSGAGCNVVSEPEDARLVFDQVPDRTAGSNPATGANLTN